MWAEELCAKIFSLYDGAREIPFRAAVQVEQYPSKSRIADWMKISTQHNRMSRDSQ